MSSSSLQHKNQHVKKGSLYAYKHAHGEGEIASSLSNLQDDDDSVFPADEARTKKRMVQNEQRG
jgi:hypothetical protein